MSRGATITRSQERAVTSFEVSVERLWTDRLTKLAPGKRVEVWLTPRWTLALQRHPMAVQVGTYSREVELAAFREDCFWMLERGRR